jgi:hypothetical protein
MAFCDKSDLAITQIKPLLLIQLYLDTDIEITEVIITFLIRYQSWYRVYVESGISHYQYRYRYRYQNQYRNLVILAKLFKIVVWFWLGWLLFSFSSKLEVFYDVQ